MIQECVVRSLMTAGERSRSCRSLKDSVQRPAPNNEVDISEEHRVECRLRREDSLET